MHKLKLTSLLILMVIQSSQAYSVWILDGGTSMHDRPILKLEARNISTRFFETVITEPGFLHKANLIMLFTEPAEELIIEVIRKQRDGEYIPGAEQAALELYQKLMFLISIEGQAATVNEAVEETTVKVLEELIVLKRGSLGRYVYSSSGLDYLVPITNSHQYYGVIDILMNEPQFLQQSNIAILLGPSFKEAINQYVEQNADVDESDILEVTSRLLDFILINVSTNDKMPQFSTGKRWLLQAQLSRLFGNFDESFDMSRFEVAVEATCKSLTSNTRRLN